MASEHRLYATHSGKDGYCGDFTLLIGQQVAFEKVGEQMLFEESLDGLGKYGISCFRSIGRYARYFGKHVTTALITASVVRHGRCFPTNRIVYTVSLTLVHYLHKGLDGPQAAWKSAIGISMNQHFIYLIDSHTYFQCLCKSWF